MHILKSLSLLGVVVGCVVTIGCSKDSSTSESPGASQGNEAPPVPATGTVPMTKLSDGQIAQIVATVDTGEIEQAQVALQKTNDTNVRAFATQMVDEHTAAKQAGAQLASQSSMTLAESPKATELQSKSQQMVEKLKQADATSFDKTYIDGQVEQHAAVLKMLDDQLLPAVTQPALRDHLNTARGMVQHHLEEARKLQK
jgi:putative membrane protein